MRVLKPLFTAILFAHLCAGASCLVIDSVAPQVQVLTGGTFTCDKNNCYTTSEPGTGADRGLVRSYQIVGHNACKVNAPATGMWSVDLAFYDKDNYRIGVEQVIISSLDVGEKFRHVYPVTADIQANGPVVTIKVREITEAHK